MDKPAIKKKVLDFTIEGVSKFLSSHPGLEFYAFAYDCTASEAEIRLCLNTEAEFQKALQRYQNGKYAHRYQSAEGIRQLKYNTGDWEYVSAGFYPVGDIQTYPEDSRFCCILF